MDNLKAYSKYPNSSTINISIVLYKNNADELCFLLKNLIQSELIKTIFLIDNSPTDFLKNLSTDSKIEYIFNNSNIGFGAGHNLAIKKSIYDKVKYHLVMNSDINFEKSILKTMVQKLEKSPDVGMIMPKILNLDGSVQILPKLLPSPFDLLIRVIMPLRHIFNLRNKQYTLSDFLESEINVPIISGCFSFFRVEALKEIGLYDERFFMYIEDFDISRRMHAKYKTIYYPKVSIVHAYERGATKSFRLFKTFIKSAILYFNKYGWFFDKERRLINRAVLNQIK